MSLPYCIVILVLTSFKLTLQSRELPQLLKDCGKRAENTQIITTFLHKGCIREVYNRTARLGLLQVTKESTGCLPQISACGWKYILPAWRQLALCNEGVAVVLVCLIQCPFPSTQQ